MESLIGQAPSLLGWKIVGFMSQDLKICTKCFVAKPQDQFSLRPDGQGPRSICKSCRADVAREKRKINPKEPLEIQEPVTISGKWPENSRLTQAQNDYMVSRIKLFFDTTDEQGRTWVLNRLGVTHDLLKSRTREADQRLVINGADLRPIDCWGPLPKDIYRVIGKTEK